MPRHALVLFTALASALLTAPAATAAPGRDVNPALFQNLVWRNIGPNLGGRSLAVAGSAARPNEYYFGATGGGLWKSTNGGTDWAPVTDHQISSSSVGAIAVCPTNPDVVYIGMGEVDLRGDVIPGDGVYKTTDGGRTWQHMGLTDAQMIGKIRVDPTHCDTLYVAALGHAFGPNAERGVFRSTDGGANWQRVLFRDALAGAVDVELDPANPHVVYASLWHAFRKPWLLESGGPGSGLFTSTDGGDTWTELTGKPGLPAGPIGKIGLAVSAARPNRVYALVEAPAGGLFRSEDAGATWQLVNNSATIRQRAFYYTHVFADPILPDRVYVQNVQLFRSDNGGTTLSTVPTPHTDNHDLWIAPDNNQRMIEGNDGGANVTVNGGAAWTAQDFPTGQFYRLTTTNDKPYLVCGEQQDRDSVCVSSTGGSDSFGVGGGESGPIAVDPRDSNVFYAGNYDWLLTRFDRGGVGERDITPWPDNPMGHPARDLLHRPQWTFPLVTTPAEPDAVYAGSQFVMKSTNGGQSWQQISPDLTWHDPTTLGDSGGPITKDQTSIEYYATVFAIAPSTVDKRIIWAGSDDGLVHVTDQGGTWHPVTPLEMTKFSRVSMIDAGHFDTGTAYLAVHRYRMDDTTPLAFRTHNGGRTWTRINTGFAPADFLWSIREDPVRPGLLYAATQHGVYVSFNDGTTWQSLRTNLPDTSVQDITVKDGDLVIATHGRGFYVLDDGATLLRRLTPKTTPKDIKDFHQTVPPVTPIPPVAPSPAVVPPTTHAPDAENAVAILRDPNNPVRSVSPNATISYTLKRDAGSATATILDPAGTPVTAFTLPTTAGDRTVTWNLRWPNAVGFPGLIYWAGSNTGPKADLGSYIIRLTVNGQTLQQTFDLLKDSRLTTVTDADIHTQFTLDLAVRDRTTDANTGVINIRGCTSQVDDRVSKAADPAVTQAGVDLDHSLSTVENALYQTKLRAAQDPLNFPIKLNDKIAGLHDVIESVDNRPTDQTTQVFTLLTSQLRTQLDNLAHIISSTVPTFNQLIQTKGLPPITCAAVNQSS
ncbi:WD40/YVTN/BNR-like repeat-containing protein [Actinocrispum wychmicini]|nr:glycosyl hydrolase [Actinocrispum wychmicini]